MKNLTLKLLARIPQAGRKLVGINLAAVIIATSFVPTISPKEFEAQAVDNTVTEAPIVLPTEKAVRYPLDQISVTQKYSFFHPGIDFDGVTGDPVYPVMKGVVVAVDHSKYDYGNAILVDHGNGVTTLYAHLSKTEVEQEQFVTPGVEIGKVGSTGHSTGDHLHFEVRKGNIPVNPMSILSEAGK